MYKFFLILFFITITIKAQTTNPCSSKEASQFDFWIGDWNVKWITKDGIEKTGSNHVINLFEGCVIEENFDGEPGNELKGKSFSVFDGHEKLWKQTWVDNEGSYLDFSGEFNDGKMILSRKSKDKNGNPIQQRMVYYNLSKNDFDWNWEISKDNGKTWDLRWKIHYSRK